jgi:putative membrane protein
MSDPRIYFTAERTQLAWLRTGLTIMGLGFVVARFGLFLTVIAASHTASGDAPHTHWESSVLGIALLLIGATTIFASLHNHRQFLRSLPPDDVPQQPIPWLTTALSAATAMVGILMAVYLAIT